MYHFDDLTEAKEYQYKETKRINELLKEVKEIFKDYEIEQCGSFHFTLEEQQMNTYEAFIKNKVKIITKFVLTLIVEHPSNIPDIEFIITKHFSEYKKRITSFKIPNYSLIDDDIGSELIRNNAKEIYLELQKP